MSKDLDGAIVILTRAREDNVALAWELREHRAEVIELPCVRTEPLADTTQLRETLARLTPVDLLVLTSRVGADAVGEAMPRGLGCGIAAVGDATAERAQGLGMRVRFVASRADGRALGRELPLPRGEVVLARSDRADGDLPALLRERGARVREVTAYRTVAELQGDAGAVRRALDRGRVTIVVASPSAVDALAAAIDAATLRRATFVALGPRSADRARARIGVTAVAADGTDVRALFAAIPPPEEAAS